MRDRDKSRILTLSEQKGMRKVGRVRTQNFIQYTNATSSRERC